MGNRLFKQRTEQQTDKNVKEVDTLSVISEHGALVEPKIEPLPAPECASACTPACALVPIIVTSDVAESLSKSLPIDIPIPEPIVELKSEIVEENNTFDNKNNNSAEIESLSSISEEDGFKSEPITEESDVSSDEDVLELDE